MNKFIGTLLISLVMVTNHLHAQSPYEVIINENEITIEAALPLSGLSHAKNDLEAILGPADVVQESTHPYLDVNWELKYGNSIFYLYKDLSDNHLDWFKIKDPICTIFVGDLGLKVGDSVAALYAAYPSQVENAAINDIINMKYINFIFSRDSDLNERLIVNWDPNTLKITAIVYAYNMT